jgi:protease-4
MRTLGTLVVLLVLLGCRRPLQVQTNSRVSLSPLPTRAVGPLEEMSVRHERQAVAKIAVIDVDGLLLNTDMVGLYSQGENPVALFREKLDRVAADPCVRGVVLRINTYGGGVTASDIMWHDLMSFKRVTGLPVVACLMDVATGGGYYLATAADEIIAHPTTITGGVGVILNTYNLQDLMAYFNVLGTPIKAGKHTDIGSPVRALDEESKQLLQDMADEFHARFQRIVQDTRPGHDAAMLDGRVFTANQALERCLIDHVGYIDDAVALAKQMAGIHSARVVFYHRQSDPARNLYSTTPNVPIQSTLFPVSIPGIDRTKLPTFLYIWQPEPTMERLSGK